MVMRRGEFVSFAAMSEKINAAVNQLPAGRRQQDEFVFLSYAEPDVGEVEKLARILQACGFTAWWSGRIRAGLQFRQEIAGRLNDAMAVVVLWTPASISSDWVISEATRAHARRALVPLVAGGALISDIPAPFDTLHTLPRDNVDGLVDALRALSERQPLM